MKRGCTVLFVRMLVFVGLVALVGFIAVNAADTPAPQQLPGEHSTLTTQDGSIRDDKLADYVASQVPKDASGNPQVKDVKIMFNSCYGGGMLDDFERVFGPGGACEGVPWVGGTASKPDECAWGHSDESVNAKPGKNLGSCWTDALHPGIRDGGNVLDGFNNAAQTDAAGPNGAGLETPVTASGNGGENIRWDAPGTKHRAVVFGGDNTNLRHDNNIENVGDALGDAWANSDGYSIHYGWGDPDDGTTQDLKDMIAAACSGLDKNTELVLYFDDHGNTEFDIDEYLAWLLETVLPGEPLVVAEPLVVEFPLHAGWVQGLRAMDDQPGDAPMPTLNLVLLEPIHSSEWEILLNGVPVLLGEGWLAGDVELPVDWETIAEGENVLEIIPLASDSSPTMVLENLELSSGPINEIEGEYPDSVTPGKTHTYGDTEGWYMVSCVLGSGTADDLYGTIAYRWNPVTEEYDTPASIEPEYGYWVFLPASTVATDRGDEVTMDVTIELANIGWHQISAPWSYPKSAIKVLKGAVTKTWADAVTAGWVRDDIYAYSATGTDYTMPSTLNPWYGYWVRANVSGLSLKLLYASGTPVSASFAPMGPKALVVPADLPPMPPSPSVGAADLEFGNYPNPIVDVHTTTFVVKGAMAYLVEAIKVQIFDLSGQLVYEAEEAGTSLDWHTDSDYGEYLANGVYLYKLYALVNGEWVASEVKKLAILR